MKSVLIYHASPLNNWVEITNRLLKDVPYDSLVINLADEAGDNGEVKGFLKLRELIKDKDFHTVTYMHSKGVTKPRNKNIEDWVELMRYFQIDKYREREWAFVNDYKLYGVNKGGKILDTPFHYSGNFVSANLKLIGDKFFSTPVDMHHLGVEAFWGKLCDEEDAYCAHYSNVDHYHQPYPEELYKR